MASQTYDRKLQLRRCNSVGKVSTFTCGISLMDGLIGSAPGGEVRSLPADLLILREKGQIVMGLRSSRRCTDRLRVTLATSEPRNSAVRAVDSLQVVFLVDNTTDILSSSPRFVETEFAGHRRRKMPWLSGKCLCCAAHGLSCLITARSGPVSRTILFDTGPDEIVFERNATRLGVPLGDVEAVVLSHGHWDHAGAMPRALQMIAMADGVTPVPTYMHPDMFALRAIHAGDGRMLPMELVPGVDVLRGSGAEVIVTNEEQVLCDEAFYLSGEIPRVTAFEKGFPGQCRQTSEGGWEPDEVMPDERFVAVHVAGKGLAVFTACSHAGVINVLTHARERFPGIPLYAVFGGFHLSGPTEAIIADTVDALAAFDLALISPGHCTGWRALNALANVFGERAVPSAVGKTFTL